jgi:hypothetical protein
VDRNLSASQSAELIADHFAAISQNYDPINLNNFSPRMREAVSNPSMSVPCLEDYEVFKIYPNQKSLITQFLVTSQNHIRHPQKMN